MSSGKTHDAWGAAAAIASTLILPSFLPTADMTAYFWGSIAGFTHLSPDIDLVQSRPSQRWLVLNYFWEPLRGMTHHRGITHTPFVGSAVVLGYAALLIGIPIAFIAEGVTEWLSSSTFWIGLFWFYVGVTGQQLVHLALDGILIKRLMGVKK